MRKNKRTTTTDIARAAGVSRATVSYVLNNTPNNGIPIRTSEKIKKIAQELNYVPSAAAKILRSGSSNLILGILPSWDLGPTYPQIFTQMGEHFSALGYCFVLHSIMNDDLAIENLLNHVSPCLIVSLQPLSEIQNKTLAAAGIPHQLIDLDAFTSLAGVTQIEYLYSRGFNRIVYVLPNHSLPKALVSTRVAAMQKRVQELGLDKLIVTHLPYTSDGIATFMHKYLSCTNPINGICAHTDEVASFIYTMLGIEKFAEGKLGLIGMGNRPISNIGLTTVRLDVDYWANTWIQPLLGILGETTFDYQPLSEQKMPIEIRNSA